MRAPKRIRKWRLPRESLGMSALAAAPNGQSRVKERFENVTYALVLECGGNGRTQFVPAARGNPWTTGGVGCARWTGVRLKDVLEAAGPKPSAVYTAHYGADPHLSGDPEIHGQGPCLEQR